MVKQYTANIYNWLKTKLNSTASNSKMNGTQSAGSSNLIARADHVHPVDTSRAPTSHASSATTYGVGSASNYGHVKVDSSPTDSSSNAVASGGVKTVLDTKQNEVETQAKVTQFTNKDRITLERIIERMNNPDSKALFLRPTDSSLPYYTFCENIKLATTYNGGVSLYLDGAAIGTSASSVVLKKIDGTKIGDFNKRGTDPAGWGYSFASAHLGVGIHYLYAEATFPDGSVRKSNILTVFVKDTNNLLDHNTWSSGEYNNNPEIFNLAPSTMRIVSNEYSNIGESSIRLTKTAASGAYARITHTENLSNKTVTASAHIRSATQKATMIIIELNGSSIVQQASVDVPANTSKTVSVSLNTGNSCSAIAVQFNNNDGKDSIIFVDDISLVSS